MRRPFPSDSSLPAALIVLLLAPASLVAQEADAQMDAYMAAAAPGPEHARLAAHAGEYEVKVEFWMGGPEPQLGAASARREMILGGRYLVEHYESEFFGEPFRGMGIFAYDNVTGKYVSTWIDTLGTGILVLEGDYDDQGRLVMSGPYVDPASGEEKTMKGVTTYHDGGEVWEAWDVAPDGTQGRVMRLTYSRKG